MKKTQTEHMKESVADKTTSCIIGKALNKNNNPLLKLKERIPAKAYKFILALDEATYEQCYMKKDIPDEKKTTLGALKHWAKQRLKNEDSDGYVTTEVTYEPRANKPKGRLYAKGMNSQYLSKPLRGIMLGKDYKDIDISNCWFSIALSICKHYENQGGKIEYKCLNYYVTNIGIKSLIK